MGNYSWGGTTVELCKSISLKELKGWGYLEGETYRSGSVTFFSRGEQTASMNIYVSTLPEDAYLRLYYYFEEDEGERHIDYKIPLERFPCNLGGGYRYYFKCPFTGKRCVKLYRPPWEYYFLHREAFTGLRYEHQIQSKNSRSFWRGPIGLLFREDELRKELLDKPKYAKLYYRDKPTPRLRKYLKVKAELSKYSRADYERILERGF